MAKKTSGKTAAATKASSKTAAVAHRTATKAAAGKTSRRTQTTAANRKVASNTQRRSQPTKRAVPALAEPLTHRLDALLHTMRCIAQHEDQLCSLLHDARRNGRVSAALRRELNAILAELPAEEYTDDLYAVVEVASAS